MSSRPGYLRAGLRHVWASYRAASLCPGVRKKLQRIVLLQAAVDISCSVVVSATLFFVFLSSHVFVGCGCGVVGVVQLWCLSLRNCGGWHCAKYG